MTTIDPTIELIRNSETFSLSTFITQGVMRLGESGVGLPPVRRLVERGPQQHGDTDVGYRLDARTISLVLLADGMDDLNDYWSLRRSLQRILKPSGIPLSLRYTLPTGEVRQIDVAYAGGLDFNSVDRFGTMHRAAIQLRAADPVWYNPVGTTIAFALPTGVHTWGIPWAIPWGIGTTTLSSTLAVTNNGDWESYPIITIIGPITSPMIANTTTSETLDFTGWTITSGTTITIDTRYGYKTVTDQTGTSHIDKLSSSSDLATFKIAAAPDAPSGVNTLTVNGSSGSSATKVVVQYNERYTGL